MNRRSFLAGAVLSPVVVKLPRAPLVPPWWDSPETREIQRRIDALLKCMQECDHALFVDRDRLRTLYFTG